MVISNAVSKHTTMLYNLDLNSVSIKTQKIATDKTGNKLERLPQYNDRYCINSHVKIPFQTSAARLIYMHLKILNNYPVDTKLFVPTTQELIVSCAPATFAPVTYLKQRWVRLEYSQRNPVEIFSQLVAHFTTLREGCD